MRVPSLGSSAIVSAGNSTYGAFANNSVVTGISGWRPTSASMLLLTFDAKGLITAAFGSSELIEPISLAYSRDLGVIGLAKTATQSVSLFKLS